MKGLASSGADAGAEKAKGWAFASAGAAGVTLMGAATAGVEGKAASLAVAAGTLVGTALSRLSGTFTV
jgi:hypothetical protein